MTERLYYTDSYLTKFSAAVVEQHREPSRLYLDRTAFYPTSGGQPHDLGTIAGIAVLDVIDEGDRIAHVLAAPVELAMVEGEIDWARRFDHMQQHTGQHLLSAVFADTFGLHTLSVHFGEETSTLDLDAPDLNAAMLVEAEERANGVISRNPAVRVSFVDAATAAGLRKEPGREGTLRIVEIEGIDKSACGGTHVRSAGEIGAILLRRQEKIRKAVRIEFVCGQRAIRRARRDFESLSRMGQQLSASIDDVAEVVAGQAAQLREAQSRVRHLEESLARHVARERYDTTAPDASGLRFAVERVASGSADQLRALALAFCALPRSAFAGVAASPPSILLATSDDSGIDAGKTLRTAVQKAGGRGGGSPRLAQGSVPTVEALEEVLRSLHA